MRAVRNISKSKLGVRDKRSEHPGLGEDEDPPQVFVSPGKSVEISDDKANELVRDYPDLWQFA